MTSQQRLPSRSIPSLGAALHTALFGAIALVAITNCGGDQVCRDGFSKVQQCVTQLDCGSQAAKDSWCGKMKVYFDRGYDSWLSSAQQKRPEVENAYACGGVVADEWAKIVECDLDSKTCGCVGSR